MSEPMTYEKAREIVRRNALTDPDYQPSLESLERAEGFLEAHREAQAEYALLSSENENLREQVKAVEARLCGNNGKAVCTDCEEEIASLRAENARLNRLVDEKCKWNSDTVAIYEARLAEVRAQSGYHDRMMDALEEELAPHGVEPDGMSSFDPIDGVRTLKAALAQAKAEAERREALHREAAKELFEMANTVSRHNSFHWEDLAGPKPCPSECEACQLGAVVDRYASLTDAAPQDPEGSPERAKQ